MDFDDFLTLPIGTKIKFLNDDDEIYEIESFDVEDCTYNLIHYSNGNKADRWLWSDSQFMIIEDSSIVNSTKLSAPELLEKAAAHMKERAVTYDQSGGERSMGKAVEAFNAITGKSLTETEGWLLLQVLKDVRLFSRGGEYHADSAEDCIAYAALKAESMQQ